MQNKPNLTLEKVWKQYICYHGRFKLKRIDLGIYATMEDLSWKGQIWDTWNNIPEEIQGFQQLLFGLPLPFSGEQWHCLIFQINSYGSELYEFSIYYQPSLPYTYILFNNYIKIIITLFLSSIYAYNYKSDANRRRRGSRTWWSCREASPPPETRWTQPWRRWWMVLLLP